MDLESLKQEEDDLRKHISQLDQDTKKVYYRLEEKRVKDPDTYAVLNYFFAAGLHHFYLGETVKGLVNVALMLAGIITIEYYGWVLILGVFIFELPQLFNSEKIILAHNNQVMIDTLSEVCESEKINSGD